MDDIRERAEKYLDLASRATEGPWVDPEIEPIYSAGVWGAPRIAMCLSSCADARFIAASRTEGPWLAQKLLEALDVLTETTGALMLAYEHTPFTTEHCLVVRDVLREVIEKSREFVKGGDD